MLKYKRALGQELHVPNRQSHFEIGADTPPLTFQHNGALFLCPGLTQTVLETAGRVNRHNTRDVTNAGGMFTCDGATVKPYLLHHLEDHGIVVTLGTAICQWIEVYSYMPA